MELRDCVAIVTGAGVRLGRAMALSLAEHGARLVVHHNRSADPAQSVVDEARSMGSEAIDLQADLSDARQVPSLVERAVAHFGQADVLVNSAAIFEPGHWDDTTEDNWDRHFNINLKAPFFLSQAFARQVEKERRAHIVNIADWRGVRPGADHVAYTLTKAALIAMTRSLALALSPSIQVNAIAPGLILPPPGQGPGYLEQKARLIPAQRAGSEAEIVKALLYLLDADFVTGELIHVTGGEHLLAGRQK